MSPLPANATQYLGAGPAELALRQSWDWVVVGAGSCGAVVAEHLSAGGADVLLLEAGPDFRPADAPAEMRRGHWSAILDIDRFPALQWTKLCASRTPQRPPTPYWRGRGAGGSSSINGQVAIRPPLDEFRAWGITEPDLWSEQAVLAGFVALEDDFDYPDIAYHGSGGPIPISRAAVDSWGQLDLAFRATLEATGHPWEPDANRPGATGVSIFPYNARREERVGTNEAYLDPARSRPNLTIIGDCLVDRVHFRGDRAVGVRALLHGQPIDLAAAGVILSAGAVHSPAILMRSGVGPVPDLRGLGLPVVADLAVGQQFQDHPSVYFGFPVDADLSLPANGRHTNACVRWTSGEAGAAPHDMMGIVNGPAPGTPRFAGLGLWVNQAFSTGTISLVSTDPTVDPAIQLNLGADPRDRRRLADCVPMALEVLDHLSFRRLVAGPIVGSNGALVPRSGDPVLIDQWVMDTVDVAAHASASCPIGPAATGGVVDSRGRVHGLEALWVIDMSVAPSAPRANTNLTAIMLAGKLAPLLDGSLASKRSGPPSSNVAAKSQS